MKHLWRGAFNYRNTAIVLYASAYSKEQAKLLMCKRLANKHDVNPSVVMGYFDGSRDNYTIEIETEFKEV